MAYLVPVALWLLWNPEYREIAFLHRHARRSVLLNAGACGAVVVLSAASAVLGMLPGIGFPLLVLAGLALATVPLTVVACSVWCAREAYQGRSGTLPWEISRQARGGKMGKRSSR